MRPSWRKLILLASASLGVLTIVGLPAWGQEAVEPDGELATAECYGHHKQEGFRSMDLFPTVLSEVPKGNEFQFEMSIRNPWLHELHQVVGYVNITGAPGLSFPGARDPEAFQFSGTPNNGGQGAAHEIPVEANATEMVVSMLGQPAGTPLDQRFNGADYELFVVSPDGSVVLMDPDQPAPQRAVPIDGRTSATVRVDQTNLTRGLGTWSAFVSYNGVAPQGAYEIVATVYYNLSRSSELVLAGPAVLKPAQQHTFTFTIIASDVEALQAMRYGGRATAHHEHTDKAIGDDGDYDKWNTLTFRTGANLVKGDGPELQGATVSLLEPVFRRWGQVLGFAGAFLVIPSLVFGGTFGRGTIEPLNRWFGGARRRVLFHNSMSFWLLGIAVLHMFIFLYEAFWSWSHGLVWGGLALASMIGLGVTGASQRSFVARWGFTRWRFVHFAMGILVFVFVLIHIVADGSHFAAIRAWFE